MEKQKPSKTSEFIKAVMSSDAGGAKKIAHAMMQDKIRIALEHEKIRVATSLFKKR